MSRPRRSTALKIYATNSTDDEMEARIEGSSFDSLSEKSALSDESDSGISGSEGSDTAIESSPKIADCLPLFSNILTEPQMILTRALVIEQTTKLARLKAAYEEHMVVAQALESKINEAERTLFENKAKLSTLNRIPLEILGVIFITHVQDNGQSPWLLMQISRAWRATALLTRVLWRGILLMPRIEHLRTATSEPAAIRRTREGMEICSSEALARSALKRAGSCPLDLKITVSKPRHGAAPKIEEAEILKLVKFIVRTQDRPRVRSLEVCTAGQLAFPIDTFDQFSFAEVESVIFDGNYQPVLRMLKEESQLLRKLHIISTSLDFLQDFGRWDQMSDLSVTKSNEDVEVDIKFALEDAVNLTSLQLVGDLLGPLDHNNHDMPELPNLARLHFRKTSNLFSFKYPNLTHLTVQYLPDWTWPPLQAKSIMLPHLVEVMCTGWSGCIGILCAIHAPSLQNLFLEGSISKTANARGFKNLWPTQSSIARERAPSGFLPVALHLKHVWLPTKAWGRIFAEQTALEECYIENGDVTAAFFEALMPVKSTKNNGSKGRGKNGPNKAGWKVDCPMLKKMVVDIGSFVLPNQRLKQSAQTFIAQRVEAGVPLERLAIRLSRNTEWEELVA